MISRLLNRQIYISILILHYIIKSIVKNCKDSKSTKEKVSGSNPLNRDYIHYSDIQIR